jgi:ABC-type transport system involved in multi-copper enzyme maturation permease subunit
MFSQLIRFEAFYQLKQRAFPLFALLFTFFGYIVGSNGFAPTNVNFNAGYQIHNFMGLFSLASVFIIMFFVISAVLRDGQHKMDNIIYSTSIRKSQFFWSRFVGVLIFSILAFTPFIIGMILGHAITPLDPERMASFNLMAYISPWLFTALPNIFICATIIFSVSVLSKSNLATYASAVFIYMFYIVCSIFLNSPLIAQSVPASPEAMAIAALADPFGLSAFFEQTLAWTPFQKNTQLVSFSGLFMWNRILWMGVSALILLVAYRVFSFRQLNQKIKKTKEVIESKATPVSYKTIKPSTALKSDLASLLSLLKLELNGVMKSLPFVTVNLIWVAISIAEIYARIFKGGEYSDTLYPLTNFIIINILDPMRLLGFVLIIFYSGELVWRERSLNFNGIIDATPVSNWALFVSKLMALLLLPAFLIGSGIIMGIGSQVVTGFFEIDLSQYLSMFYFNGLQLFLFSVLAVFIQSLVRNKYLGMGITGVIILASFLSPQIGIEHSLLRFGFLPDVSFSNMIGYSADSLEFFHLAIYWIGLTGLMTLVSFKLWQRGIGQHFQLQIRSLLTNWKMWERIVLASFLMIFIGGGTTVYYHMHVTNEYITGADFLDVREAYERKFKQYEALPRLYLLDVKTTVDLYPEESGYDIKADYVLVNNEDYAITELFITARVPLNKVSLENAELVEQFPEYDSYLFKFNKPVEPNQSVKFNYEINYKVTGYKFDQEIVKNGTYLSHRSFEPSLSYRSGMEIPNNFEREKRGLPIKETEDVNGEPLALADIKAGRVNYETVVSTSGDEIALSSGNLLKEWKQDGRNYFHYKADQKIMPTVGYLSSGYDVQKEDHNGVGIEQYYYPGHDYNIDSIASSTAATLDYCIQNFGAFPFDQIRIVEIPNHWPFGGFAHSGLIGMVEDRLYLTDLRNPNKFNLVAKRTIHEVAHQWWGHVLAPKVVSGGSMFIEGLTKYTEAVIMDKIYGKRAIYQLSESANRRYFTGRAWSATIEPPLYQVFGQGYLSYGKNYSVMIALRDLIGEDTLNLVLRTIADRYRDDIQFSATSLEFLEELYKVSPQEHHVLIDDWIKRVITYDLSVEDVSHRELDNGKFELTMTVNAKRFEMQESGETTPIGINEPIQIGLFEKHPSLIGKDGGTIYLQPHQISEDGQEVKVIVDELPNYVSIDPYGTRVDENMYDNVKML